MNRSEPGDATMHIEIAGRQVEVTPSLREFTLDKLRKLEKLLDGPLEVHVVLTAEKHRQHAEIQVKSRTAILSGAEETDDLFASISEVADKLERQALKHKEKVTERKRREGRKLSEAEAQSIDSTSSTAADGSRRLIPSERYRLKPLSPEDAALELEAIGDLPRQRRLPADGRELRPRRPGVLSAPCLDPPHRPW
jgi:putative sigma-54 modulation protein